MTGLLYVAIVGLWAAVLIPMWLSRHDADEAHRRQRHEQALGVLSRFKAKDTGSVTAAQRAVRRRRVIGVTLVALAAAGATAWALGLAAPWVMVTPLVLLAGFVGLAVAMGATRSRQLAARNHTSARQLAVEQPAQVQRQTAAPRRRSSQRSTQRSTQSSTQRSTTAAHLEDRFDQTG